LLDFLAFLSLRQRLAPRTVMNYRASLALPLKLGFQVDTSDFEFSLEARGAFLKCPPAPRLVPSWSITDVLAVLKTPRFVYTSLSKQDLFAKT
jgi:hypothetical protein